MLQHYENFGTSSVNISQGKGGEEKRMKLFLLTKSNLEIVFHLTFNYVYFTLVFLLRAEMTVILALLW